jgi:hypothetical protein
MLVTAEMVEQMKPGSVVVDLAAETGGNVQGSVAGKVVRIGHAQVWGGDNVPSQMPGPASKLYAQNLVSLLTLMTREGAFDPDFEDEVVAGAAVTHAGRIVHEPTREAVEGPAEPEAGAGAGGFETLGDARSSTSESPDARSSTTEGADPRLSTTEGADAHPSTTEVNPPSGGATALEGDQQLDLPFDQEEDK